MVNDEARKTEWNEQACIAAAQEDPSAFAELYECYVDRIYNYVYHRVGNSHDAEDLTSRTFFRALSHIQSYQDRGYPFSAWLYRIAHNLIANWYRDRKRKPMVSMEDLVLPGNPKEEPESQASTNDNTRMLQLVIATLDPARQELLHLKYQQGLSNLEIGRIMGRTEGAIKSLYHRTLLQLRKEMQSRGIGEHEQALD